MINLGGQRPNQELKEHIGRGAPSHGKPMVPHLMDILLKQAVQIGCSVRRASFQLVRDLLSYEYITPVSRKKIEISKS
jgi:hypothetical protein